MKNPEIRRKKKKEEWHLCNNQSENYYKVVNFLRHEILRRKTQIPE